MTSFSRLTIVNIIFLLWSQISLANVIYYGDCNLGADPIETIPSIVNLCLRGFAGTWITQKSRTNSNAQSDIRHHAEADASLFITPWISGHTSGHTDVFVSRTNSKTTWRDSKQDSWNFQIGNNSLSRHRVNIGKGHPAFRINHDQRQILNYSWNINSFTTPLVNYALYTYDNQLDWTVQTTYGRLADTTLNDRQRIFGAGRIMYDIAALEGTRLSLGGHGDGLLRRAIAVGILNINGKGDETALEVTRSFSLFPYDPKEFKQLIRLSYLSHEQDRTQLRFQYEDEFRHIRNGSFGVVFLFQKFTQFEIQLGYAKYEDSSAPSHWYTSVSGGVHL